MYYIKKNDIEKPRCEKCQNKLLTPVRWVRVCERGHMDDIDWHYMVHRNAQQAATGPCEKNSAYSGEKMKFITKGARGGDFESLRIVCACGATTNLSFVPQKILPGKCSGRQPWQYYEHATECKEKMKIEPRGSSAIHYAKILSALDFPTKKNNDDSNIFDEFMENNQMISFIRDTAPTLDELQPQSKDLLHKATDQYAEDIGYEDKEKYFEIILNGLYKNDNISENASEEILISDTIQQDIINEEYNLLKKDSNYSEDYFTSVNNTLEDDKVLSNYFRKIIRIERLKEVRIFTKFCRLDPSYESVQADLGQQRRDWLPASEVIGEGIFLEFNPDTVSLWEETNTKENTNRLSALFKRADDLHMLKKLNLLETPRFIMIHTLAHLLIRQLAFDCGYSSSSLRERIYCRQSKDSAGGLLIYTADSDSEGSMGGLVELGYPARFKKILKQAIKSGLWCSSDPICQESKGQGLHGLNKAGCHACSLLSETSCAHNNIFLDRILLVGDVNEKTKDRPVGYFSDLIRDELRFSK